MALMREKTGSVILGMTAAYTDNPGWNEWTSTYKSWKIEIAEWAEWQQNKWTMRVYYKGNVVLHRIADTEKEILEELQEFMLDAQEVATKLLTVSPIELIMKGRL